MPDVPAPARRATLTTGASTGIGRACARMLAQRGFLSFAGVRKESDAQSIRDEGIDGFVPVMIDVTDAASIAACAEFVTAQTGGVLAGLVNNAGIVVASPIEVLPLDDLRRQFEVNVVGQIAVTQAFLPALRAGGGRIANITSIGGKITTPFMGPYCASKFAMESFSDALRRELRPWTIHVAAIEPGVIQTAIWAKGKSTMEAFRATHGEGSRAMELYAGPVASMGALVERSDKGGIPPEAVGRAVLHCFTARRPKTRYPVGIDARVGRFLAVLVPDRLIDWGYSLVIK